MNSKSHSTCLTALIAALVATSSAHAADGAPSFGAAAGGYFADEMQAIGSTFSVHARGGYWINPTVGFELDLGFMPAGQTQVGTPDPLPYFGMAHRVNLTGRVFEDKPVQLLLSAGLGAIFKNIDDPEDTLGLPTEGMDVDFLGAAGPGLFIPLGSSGLGLRADFNWLLNAGSENWQNHGDTFLDYELTGGLHYLPGGPKDSDKDGIVDDIDQCVDQPEDIDGYMDEDGCPDSDNDDDGIPDTDDSCPTDAEDIDEWEDDDGCPDADNDGDGVIDADDACPVDAGTAETNGCPDTDGDGLPDNSELEECPNEAGPEESFGCPDADGDRVPDHRDDCPDEAANEGINPLRSDGCPAIAYVADGAIKITEKVQFATGSAEIKSDSHELLDSVAELLTKYKGIKKVEVAGHTDSQGNDEKNLTLSQSRAEAVVAYLVGKGVAEDRLEAKGYGETKPIGDNDTKEGREQNRRVEFTISADDVGKRAKQKMKKSGTVEKKPEGEEATDEAADEEATDEAAEEEAAEGEAAEE
jgi:outer membrane protein OmpA-like peptidoglycan-associated protein